MRAGLVPILFQTVPTGGLGLIYREPQGLGIDFTVVSGLGSIACRDTTTPTNNLSNVTADQFLSQSGTSPHLVLWSDSLYRWTPHNLLVRSELLTNASWNTVNLTVAAGATDPNGGTGAFTLTATGGGALIYQNPSTVTGADATTSIWIKRRTGTGLIKAFTAGGGAGTTLAVTSTWTQFSATIVGEAPTYSGVIVNTNGDEIDVWHPQFNRGTTPTSYHVTTAAAWYGVPIRYNATVAGFRMVSETAATNIALYASDLTNAAWTKSNMTTALTATGPDGVANTATTLTATAGNATALQAITSGSASRVTSVLIKRRTGTGNIDLTQDNGSTWATVAVTSSWARFTVAAATAANPTVGIRIVTSADAVDVWVFQHELTLVTSPVPTWAASVTRAADIVQAATTTFPLGTAHTLIAKFSKQVTDQRGVAVSLGDTTGGSADDISLDGQNDGKVRAYVETAGVLEFGSLAIAVYTADTFLKAGIAAATNSVNAAVNGTIAGADDTSVALPTVNVLTIGHVNVGAAAQQLNGEVESVVYLPRRMTNAEVTAKTAP